MTLQQQRQAEVSKCYEASETDQAASLYNYVKKEISTNPQWTFSVSEK